MATVLTHATQSATQTTAACLAAIAVCVSSPACAESDAKPINELAALSAFATVRKWVDAFEVPKADSLLAHIAIDQSTGVCVIVRRSGRVLGIGADFTGDDLMLRRAAASALGQTLGDSVVASMPEDMRSSIGPKLTLELEIASPLSPLVGHGIGQIASKLEPGLDGMAIRHERSLQMLFPAQLRATNTADDPAGRLLALAMKSGLPVKDLGELSNRADVTVYSFRTVHLVQNGPDQPPFVTFRGDVLVPQESVNNRSIQAMGDALATHIIESIWPAPPRDPNNPNPPPRRPLGLMGDYQPVADQYRPMIASPLEQALGALALLRYTQTPGLEESMRERCQGGAQQILRDLSIVSEGEEDPHNDIAASAVFVLCAATDEKVLVDPAIHSFFEDCVFFLKDAFNPETLTFSTVDSEDRRVHFDPHIQSIVVAALCKMLAMKIERVLGGEPLDAGLIRTALNKTWEATPVHERIAMLPWIAWAEVDYARATGRELAHVDDLRTMRDALMATQVRPNQPDTEPDLVGGLSLRVGDPVEGRTALPDSQSARPAAWLGSILGDPRIVPADQVESTVTAQNRLMRFLMQLSVRESFRSVMRNSKAAMGGIRNSLWNSDEPVAAQDLALLAVAETLQAVPLGSPANSPK